MLLAKEVRLNGTENYQKEPSECKAHVHVTQNGILPEYLTVKEALHEDLPQTVHEGSAEEASLQTELVGPGEVAEPDGTAYNTVDQYEIKTQVERPYEEIRAHCCQVF